MPVDAEQRARCERIRDKGRELFGRQNVGDCESLAQLIEWAFQEYRHVYFDPNNNDEETFVEDFGLVLTERSEWVLWSRSDDLDLYLGMGYATDTCFRRLFQDGSNQVRHFWGYVMLSFQYGSKYLGKLATVREYFPFEHPDERLGAIGANIGAGLDGAGIALDELPTFIREWLCKKDGCFVGASGVSEEEEEEEDGD